MKQPVLFGNGGSPIGDWFQTIAVSAPSGASITVSGGGETLTATGTGTYYAFDAHNKSTTYTITATIDGVAATSQTVTTGTASGVISFIDIAFGTINLTYADEFRGVSISCANGGTTITKTAPAVGNLMAFYPPNTGTWTISATVSGDTYTTTAEVTSLSTPVNAELITVPDGSTVLPKDDIEIWLACANINKSYTTLAEVLADTDTLQAIISNNNAVDYMVRSTTWATDVCADSNAMRYIGKRNYASDALLADSDWCQAIVESDYCESILTNIVPVLSSDSQDGYVVTESSNYQSPYRGWKLFDGNNQSSDSVWYIDSNYPAGTLAWVKIKLPAPKRVIAAKLFKVDGRRWQSVYFKGSKDNWATEENLCEPYTIADINDSNFTIIFDKSKIDSYVNYQIIGTTKQAGAYITGLAYYSRIDVDESNIDIYSAANDTITITPQGGGASLTVVTDSAGHGTIARSNLPAGTYTFTSSVAKDPNNLSNDYSKTITVDGDEIELCVMPDNTIYWWGYIDAEASGFSRGFGANTSSIMTLDTNKIRLKTVSTNSISACTNNKIVVPQGASNLCITWDRTETYNAANSYNTFYMSDSGPGQNAGFGQIQAAKISAQTYPIRVDKGDISAYRGNSYYVHTGVSTGTEPSSGDTYAIWFE